MLIAVGISIRSGECARVVDQSLDKMILQVPPMDLDLDMINYNKSLEIKPLGAHFPKIFTIIPATLAVKWQSYTQFGY